MSWHHVIDNEIFGCFKIWTAFVNWVSELWNLYKCSYDGLTSFSNKKTRCLYFMNVHEFKIWITCYTPNHVITHQVTWWTENWHIYTCIFVSTYNYVYPTELKLRLNFRNFENFVFWNFWSRENRVQIISRVDDHILNQWTNRINNYYYWIKIILFNNMIFDD